MKVSAILLLPQLMIIISRDYRIVKNFTIAMSFIVKNVAYLLLCILLIIIGLLGGIAIALITDHWLCWM